MIFSFLKKKPKYHFDFSNHWQEGDFNGRYAFILYKHRKALAQWCFYDYHLLYPEYIAYMCGRVIKQTSGDISFLVSVFLNVFATKNQPLEINVGNQEIANLLAYTKDPLSFKSNNIELVNPHNGDWNLWTRKEFHKLEQKIIFNLLNGLYFDADGFFKVYEGKTGFTNWPNINVRKVNNFTDQNRKDYDDAINGLKLLGFPMDDITCGWKP